MEKHEKRKSKKQGRDACLGVRYHLMMFGFAIHRAEKDVTKVVQVEVVEESMVEN